ncbi:Facilitated trehalose transporter Tret1 [Eumeta japonica]|uniref:Facilitated trehalose transporter Tret1 n=1 Tax=Eumeta variegata TaxID=151549 RepID=A0A4C1XR54_EUMVA|nr:Facilitated trehalose transporter Tret1 [Eumeta japonica]
MMKAEMELRLQPATSGKSCLCLQSLNLPTLYQFVYQLRFRSSKPRDISLADVNPIFYSSSAYDNRIESHLSRPAGTSRSHDCLYSRPHVRSRPSSVLRFGPGAACDSVPIRFYSRIVRNSLPHPAFNPDFATSHNSDLDEAENTADADMAVDGNAKENADPTVDGESGAEKSTVRSVFNVMSSKESLKSNKSDKDTKRLSNYLDNIKKSASALGLDSSKPDKDVALLRESNVVRRFSPVYRQGSEPKWRKRNPHGFVMFVRPLSLAAAASILVTFTAGLTSGYSAILIPELENSNGTIPGDRDTTSWIAAMAVLPMAPGCLISGWLMERFGRRTSHFIICAPFLLGWIFISFANELTLMLMGRFFTGLCTGLLGPLAPVYIGESTDPKYRGFFLAAVSLAIAVGILVAHLIGTFVTWRTTAMTCSVFPVLSAILLIFVPESPTWLISKGRIDAGVKSFAWLRGCGKEANAELKAIMEKQKIAAAEPPMKFMDKIKLLKSPELLKPLMIMIIFFSSCQFSGVNAIVFYSVEFVKKSVDPEVNRYMVMLIIDVVRVVMSVVACIVCRMFGRRPLCFISGIWTALSMFGLSIFVKMTADHTVSGMSWISIMFLMSYICAISVGLVPLPWIMCGELFPSRVRGLGSGISSATTFIAFFFVVKTAPTMLSDLGEFTTFLIYGAVTVCGTFVLYFILPETKGKSLQEIEDKFKSVKRKPATAELFSV